MFRDGKPDRRQYLKAAGVTGVTALAGCTGGITGGGGPIPVGSILPLTGALGQYGKGMQKAVEIAFKDVNNAGGPLGREIKHFPRDSETKPSRAVQKYNSLVSEQNIEAFVGAASSGVSVPLAEKVYNDKVMQVSNASTTPALAEIGYGQDGEPPKYFGRTAPNDGQQGLVMGKILNDYVKADTAAFLYVNNAYGRGLAEKAKAAFNGETLQLVGYSKKASSYTSTLDKLHKGDPDGIGFVGYPGNGKTIMKQWSQGGFPTNAEQWVLSEGLNSDTFFKNNRSIVGGMYLSTPDPRDTPGSSRFKNKIGESNTLFAAHAYDAAFLIALAMHKGGEGTGKAAASNMQSVSRDGKTVTVGQFQKAKNMLDNGENVNYQGASSPVDMNNALEPLNPFAIVRVTKSGSKLRKTLESIPLSYFEGKL